MMRRTKLTITALAASSLLAVPVLVTALEGPATRPTTMPTAAELARTGPTTAPSATTRPSEASNRRRRPDIPPAAARRSDEPTPRPQPMGGEYALLTTRSIFYKGFPRPAEGSGEGGGAPAQTPQQQAEASLVFNGIIIADGRATAMLEDSRSHQVTGVRVGDTIAAGKIVGITLDRLDYEADNRITHVAIGQNLHGDRGDSSALSSATTQPSGTTPSAPGAAPAPLSNSKTESILEQMRQRRMRGE